MAHVWVVEVRMRPQLMNGQRGQWTKWNPMDAWRPGDADQSEHMSVPNSYHGKKLAEWECRRCREITVTHPWVQYRVRRYDRREG